MILLFLLAVPVGFLASFVRDSFETSASRRPSRVSVNHVTDRESGRFCGKSLWWLGISLQRLNAITVHSQPSLYQGVLSRLPVVGHTDITISRNHDDLLIDYLVKLVLLPQ